MDALEEGYRNWDTNIYHTIDDDIIMNVYGMVKESVSDFLFERVEGMHSIQRALKRKI